MIGRLKGIVIHKQPPWLVVDVHGVGYELEAPMSTFYDLPDVGREVSLFTHYAQKEDSVSLYGFLRESERRLLTVTLPLRSGKACFRLLTTNSLTIRPSGTAASTLTRISSSNSSKLIASPSAAWN